MKHAVVTAVLKLTGPVQHVDANGYFRVAGITFSAEKGFLPRKGQIVQVQAGLAQVTDTGSGTPAIWPASSLLAFPMPAEFNGANPSRTHSHAPPVSIGGRKPQTPAAVNPSAKVPGGRFADLNPKHPGTRTGGTGVNSAAQQRHGPARPVEDDLDDDIPF